MTVNTEDWARQVAHNQEGCEVECISYPDVWKVCFGPVSIEWDGGLNFLLMGSGSIDTVCFDKGFEFLEKARCLKTSMVRKAEAQERCYACNKNPRGYDGICKECVKRDPRLIEY